MTKAEVDEQFLLQKARLRRILRSCGWTFHLQTRASGVYAAAAKRDAEGGWHGQHIAPMGKVDMMDTGSIKAILPKIA